MIKKTICQECHTANMPGSKFCSNCGSRLPKSTSIICPRCQSPNPSSNFYCDSCGSRLTQESAAASGSGPAATETTQAGLSPSASSGASAADEDLPTSAKMFSLPTRKPGETGELNADNVMDWLKSGASTEAKPESGKLPRLSDLTPEQRETGDDLPAWLLDSDSRELLIPSPEDITTEHFLNLVQQIDEEERKKLSGMLSESALAGEGSGLPDWLQDFVQSGKEASPDKVEAEKRPSTPPSPAADADDDNLDWLSELGPAHTDGLAQPVDNTAAHSRREETGDLPDWLSELGPPNTEMLARPQKPPPSSASEPLPDAGETPDWLDELGPLDTDMLAHPQEPATADYVADGAETPAWLLDEQPDTDGLAAPPGAPVDDGDDRVEELPDWLVAPIYTDSLEMPAAPAPEAPLETANEMAAKSLTDWLTSFDEAEGIEEEDIADEEETAVSPVTEAATRKTLTDWLNALPEDPILPDPDTPEPEEEAQPDWLTPDEEAAEEDLAFWLDEASDDPAARDDEEAEDVAWLAESLESDAPAETAVGDPDDSEAMMFGMTGPLPDWLDELEPDTTTGPPVEEAIMTGFLDDLFGAPEPTPEPEAPPLNIDDLSLVDDLPLIDEVEEIAPDLTAAEIDEEPDWLNALATFDTDGLTAVATDPTDTPQDDLDEEDDSADELDDQWLVAVAELDEPAELAETAVDLSHLPEIEDILAGKIDSEEFPEWLDQFESSTGEFFGEATATAEDEDATIATSDLPEWIANLRPDESGLVDSKHSLSAQIPAAIRPEDDDLYALDAELGGDELPEWLQDGEIGSPEMPAPLLATSEEASWIDTESDLGEPSVELESILAELPAAPSPDELLMKAEIPDWIQDLKPPELSGQATPVVDMRVETTGPLAGVLGAIRVEPIVAMPRAIHPPTQFAVTEDQRQQARLLRQLVQETQAAPAVSPAAAGGGRANGLRWFVALLLLVAVLVGLLGPDIGGGRALPPTAATVAVHTAVTGAAAQPVLVAIDYTPALAGELSHAATLLLRQLQANGSQVLTVSQYPAGTAVAADLTADLDGRALGLLTGEAIGLRQLGNCLSESGEFCASLQGRPVDAATQAALQEVALVILLTGERSSLVNWVEQVAAVVDAPLVVGSTQALAPVVAPYYSSGQIEGYLDGLPAALAYAEAFGFTEGMEQAQAQSNAQTLLQLIAALLLLGGALFVGLGNGSRKRHS